MVTIIENLVSTLEDAAALVTAQNQDSDALKILQKSLSDPAVRKIVGSRQIRLFLHLAAQDNYAYVSALQGIPMGRSQVA